jgi:hypothetical protein
MKTTYTLFVLCLLTEIGIAQSVTIDPSNSNANLIDAKANSKGILIPKMTTTQKLAIVNPTEGLMVYDTDVKQFSYCLNPVPNPNLTNCTWVNFGNVQMPSTGWMIDGNDVKNTNTGNIGIGTTSPTHAKLEMRGQVGSAVAMFGSDKNGVTISADNPEIGLNYFYNNGTKTIKAGYGANFGMFPNTGDVYIGNFNGNQSSTDFGAIAGYQNVVTIKQNGRTGIGTPDPFTKLDVEGGLRAKELYMPIKFIPHSVDYTVESGDYSLVINANTTCFTSLYITLPYPITNPGRVLNIKLRNTANCNNSIIRFKDHLGNIIYDSDGILLFYYTFNGDTQTVHRTSITLQSTGIEWIKIADNFFSN